MASVEAVGQPISNAQSAQDVQNMLAELKGSQSDSGTAAAAAAEGKDVAQGSNGIESTEAKTNDVDENNNAKVSDSKNEAEPEEDKKNEGTEPDKGGRSGGHQPSRGGARGRGGGRGRGDFKSYKKNIKSDLTAQQETDDPVQIRKQVEFYFSDSNLPMDKFLLSQVGGSKNLAVDLKIIHSFKRMRHFQPFSAIVSALKESTFLELTDDDTKVKRKEALPEIVDPEKIDPDSIKVFEDRALPRSVYVKGFGEEDSKTQLDIEDFFAPYGPYNAIRLRRAHDKVFKGSVFVEFDSEETQKKFLDLDPKPKYKGKDLQIMSKRAYCDKKVEDIKSGKIKGNGRDHHRGRGGYQNKRKRDDEDDRDWRERREDDRKNGLGRDSRRGGRGGRGRDSKREKGTEIRKDARGVPIVEATQSPTKDDSARAKREAATADALAKAKAMVEAENTKTISDKVETDNANIDAEARGKTDLEANTTAEDGDVTATVGAIGKAGSTNGSKKRGREEVEAEAREADDLPEAKRVNTEVKEDDGKQSMES